MVKKSQGIAKIVRVHPLTAINLCNKFQVSQTDGVKGKWVRSTVTCIALLWFNNMLLRLAIENISRWISLTPIFSVAEGLM